jgi:hypothetical protein
VFGGNVASVLGNGDRANSLPTQVLINRVFLVDIFDDQVDLLL